MPRPWPSLAFLAALAGPAAAADAPTLYVTHCASCHGADRLGAIGPALLGSLTLAGVVYAVQDRSAAVVVPDDPQLVRLEAEARQRLSAEDVVRKGWITSLPRWRYLLNAALRDSA